jgi:hypothetical protein
MGHKITADMYQMDMMRLKYGPRKGLEGPFNFSGRVLYYDAKEGQYYDPTCDWYVSDEEMTLIRDGFLKHFA